MATGARLAAAGADAMPAEVQDESAFPPLPVFFAFIMMAFGMFMAILDIQIVSASLGQIQAGLAASADEISWVQTSYLVAEVVMIPLSGFLSRALSIRWLFVFSCAGFTLASLLCALSTSIGEMIAARALQGFVGGAMIPTVYAASFLMFGRKRQTGVTVTVSFIVTLAPTLGPALGGWITSVLSWHWLFLINIIPGILISFGVATLVKLDAPNLPLLKKIDLLGLVALAATCGGAVFVLEEGARYQWFEDRTVLTMACVALCAALLLWWRVTTAEEPIVSFRPLGNLNFLGGSLMGAVFGIGLYGLVYLYPLYLARIAGLSSGQIGNTVFVTGLFMALGAPIAGWVSQRIDVRVMACIGFLLLATSTWMTHYIDIEWRFNELVLPQALRGLGIMCCIVSVSVMSFGTLPNPLIKDATGLFTLFRNVGGAIGIAIINTIVLERFNHHYSRLGEATNPGRAEIVERYDMMTGLAAARGMPDPEGFALRALANEVNRQALVMSYADAFWVLSLLFVAFSVVPLFLKKPGTFADAQEVH
ncbi:DHA2 family efflux MFS transporter permease subunit [Sandaracinobacteroides saxicola]|uniref:DHA2 family efflux MFS transporter permease subunit n=1 Tax=Sandaracinobacteroides saxicola TaxID=2759707 RepID=A0A7G5IHD9_9SPHN|nr:DHA2 family efflux MFS transporter permease subunit [Sandaracinobacteroides saxicola]QMW22781.1 DHA2 family efflux MFS transporter permease subunit [Sandaracinobacteroides saxicola]